MNSLICYCTGALSNRILPLASCIEFSKATGRKLFLYWPTDRICGGCFSEFFDDDIPIVDEDFLRSLEPDHTEYHARFVASVTNDMNLYGRSFLHDTLNDGRVTLNDEPSPTSEFKNIVYSTNTFLGRIPPSLNKEAVRGLMIKKEIKDKACGIAAALGLDRSVIGAHLRGTDFNRPFSFYEDQIRPFVASNKNVRIFISSDDSVLEDHIAETFAPNIIRRNFKRYVRKNNEDSAWGNNTFIDSESIRDALVDILLLSKTNFKIYNTDSSFATYVQIMNEQGATE